jgi:hypothetical protein
MPGVWVILDQLQMVPLVGSTGPQRTKSALRFSVLHPESAQPISRHEGATFLGQQSIRSRQILRNKMLSLVQKNSLFMPHDWGGKAIAIRIFLSRFLQTWPDQCGWKWWGYTSGIVTSLTIATQYLQCRWSRLLFIRTTAGGSLGCYYSQISTRVYFSTNSQWLEKRTASYVGGNLP